jgi:Bacterial pre-peptidase C-terminal domain
MPDNTDIGNTIKDALKLQNKDFSTAENPLIFNSTTVPHATVSSAIDTPNDVDFIRVSAKEGELITLDIDFGLDEVSFLDTIVSVFDHKMNLLAVNDDGGLNDPGSISGLDSFLEFVVPKSGQYFIAVSSFANFYDPTSGSWSNNGGSAGDYSLNISVGNSIA